MNKPGFEETQEQERCPICHSVQVAKIGMDTDGYRVGMECEEWHCGNCDSDFAVGCQETQAWLEAHPEVLLGDGTSCASRSDGMGE